MGQRLTCAHYPVWLSSTRIHGLGFPGLKTLTDGTSSPAAGMYAAVMRFSGSLCGVKSSGRRASVRPLNSEYCLSQADPGNAVADLRDMRDDATETSDACDQRGKHRARLLSRFSAGPECGRDRKSTRL